MKRIQIEAHADLGDGAPTDELLRAAGVKRIHAGWYTVTYNGVRLDRSTVVCAKRNHRGELRADRD